MIAMEVQTTVYSPPMDPLTVVYAFPGNKKEDPVVETRVRNIKNNVTLPVNVLTQTVIILSLEHVKNYHQIKLNN
jgi:hypothetical protein